MRSCLTGESDGPGGGLGDRVKGPSNKTAARRTWLSEAGLKRFHSSRKIDLREKIAIRRMMRTRHCANSCLTGGARHGVLRSPFGLRLGYMQAPGSKLGVGRLLVSN